MQLALTARQPFNFSSVVNSHGWVQLAPCSFDQGSGLFTYLDRLSSGRAVEYRIRAAVEGVQVETEKLREAERAEAAARVSWMLGLDMDFSAFYAACRKEPKLRNAEKQAKGRVLRSPTLFEDVVKTILTTNTMWGATKRMNANLIAQFGEPLPGDETRRAFPTPERLAAAGPEVLRDTVKLGYRAPYVH